MAKPIRAPAPNWRRAAGRAPDSRSAPNKEQPETGDKDTEAFMEQEMEKMEKWTIIGKRQREEDVE